MMLWCGRIITILGTIVQIGHVSSSINTATTAAAGGGGEAKKEEEKVDAPAAASENILL